jgi:hypothetical protein
MRSLKQFWTVRRIGEDRVTLARLGPMRLWLARAEREWGFAFHYGEEDHLMELAQVPEDVVPDDLEWVNMLFREAPREYRFDATVPDRPVVIRPMHPVTIAPGDCGEFYACLPLFVKITLMRGKTEQELGTVSSQMLSSSWFGDFRNGLLCYTGPVAASLELEGLSPDPNHILCSVMVENRSEETIYLEKLCLRPDNIGLFCGDTHLWGTAIRIQHEDGYASTTVRYAREAPRMEDGLVELAKPKKRSSTVLQHLSLSASFNNDIVFGK